MPRKRALTWQPGAGERPGRWRKKFRGRSYYFSGGRGKTDQEAYQAAVDEWEKLRSKLRAEVDQQHLQEYEREIATWSQVLSWSRQNGDEKMIDTAAQRIGRLRVGLTAPSKPPAPADTFNGYFEPVIRHPTIVQSIQELSQQIGRRSFARLEGAGASDSAELPAIILPTYEPSGSLWDFIKVEKEVWRDRLQVMHRAAPDKEKMAAAQMQRFLQIKEHEVSVGRISTNRLYTLRLHLSGFIDWLGGETAVDRICGQDLINYRLHLLKKVAEGQLGKTTAHDRLGSVKSFVRWLWQTEAIADLPRVLHPRSKLLEIGNSFRKILTHTEAEVATLLNKSSERTRLYILLTLNTAMTQKDIADLVNSEVDWEQGRIIRKRSKTKTSDNVPTVSYLLWPETRELLLKHRSHQVLGPVLLNIRGEPLLTERFNDDGKYSKMDNIRNAFERLRRKTKIDKPFKCLKKTSASLLRDHEESSSIVGLFLGHAPRDVSERFYAAAPQQLLDRAILWLRDHYAEHECFATKSTPLKH